MYGPSRLNNDVATRKKRTEEKAKERREAKDKSYEDYPWTELCEDVTKLKKLHVPELNKYSGTSI